MYQYDMRLMFDVLHCNISVWVCWCWYDRHLTVLQLTLWASRQSLNEQEGTVKCINKKRLRTRSLVYRQLVLGLTWSAFIREALLNNLEENKSHHRELLHSSSILWMEYIYSYYLVWIRFLVSIVMSCMHPSFLGNTYQTSPSKLFRNIS